MITKLLRAASIAALTLGAVTVATPAVAQTPPPAAQAAILIVDMERLGAESAAGKSGAQQLQSKAQAVQARAKQLGDSLNAEVDAVRRQQQTNAMAPEALQAKERELNQKQNTYRQEIANREQDLARSQAYVREQIFGAVGPIIQQVMRERGASVVVAREAALAFNQALDVTSEVVRRLDTALPRVSVTPPAQQAPATTPAATPAPATKK